MVFFNCTKSEYILPSSCNISVSLLSVLTIKCFPLNRSIENNLAKVAFCSNYVISVKHNIEIMKGYNLKTFPIRLFLLIVFDLGAEKISRSTSR